MGAQSCSQTSRKSGPSRARRAVKEERTPQPAVDSRSVDPRAERPVCPGDELRRIGPPVARSSTAGVALSAWTFRLSHRARNALYHGTQPQRRASSGGFRSKAGSFSKPTAMARCFGKCAVQARPWVSAQVKSAMGIEHLGPASGTFHAFSGSDIPSGALYAAKGWPRSPPHRAPRPDEGAGRCLSVRN